MKIPSQVGDLLDVLVDIAAALEHNDGRNEPCQEQQFTPGTRQTNNATRRSRTKSGVAEKKPESEDLTSPTTLSIRMPQ